MVSFSPMSNLGLIDISNSYIFISTELCTPEFLIAQIYSYHSGKHYPHDTVSTPNSTRYRYKKWSVTSSA